MRSTSPSGRSRATSTSSPAWWPSSAGRDDEQPVGAHQRGQHAGAARQRRGHDRAADAAEAHAHPVVHAHHRVELAGQPGPRAWPLGRRGALQAREQGGGEDLEGQGGGHRVAGGAQHRGAVDRAEHDRVAGAHRDAVDREHTGALDHRGGVVVAPGARAGADDQQVAALHGRVDDVDQAVGIVGLDRQALDVATRLAGLRGEHQRVGVEHLARRGRRADLAHLVPGREDRHARASAHRQLDRARRGGRRDVDRAQAMALGQQQLGRADVLADGAHVLVGNRCPAQLRRPVLRVVDLLAHDHGVAAVRQRVAGVDHVVARGRPAGPAPSRSRRWCRPRARRCRPSRPRRTAARSGSPTPARR